MHHPWTPPAGDCRCQVSERGSSGGKRDQKSLLLLPPRQKVTQKTTSVQPGILDLLASHRYIGVTFGPLAQFGRAPQWHCGGHRFDPGTVHKSCNADGKRTIAVIVLFLFHCSDRIRKLSVFPTKIGLSNQDTLSVLWDDGHQEIVSLRTLRDRCPCASCQGETVLLRSYKPPPQPSLPGKYTLKGAEQVGSYALQLTWGDGHATGIYSWDLLRSLCECDECRTGEKE